MSNKRSSISARVFFGMIAVFIMAALVLQSEGCLGTLLMSFDADRLGSCEILINRGTGESEY